MKRMMRTAAALALAGCMMVSNVFAAPTFQDVPSSFWGYTFINQAAEAGLVSGMGDGTFGVNGKLSAAQFTAMVCNLLCKDEVQSYHETYKPADWWRAYMAVAYTKGILKNTTVGDSRTANNAWSATQVNGEISRYDMAQIMVNVAEMEKWEMPTTQERQAAQGKIADWKSIPAKYQNAVAVAYAKGYLSGMDDKGTFAGNQSMTRTHGAVVICKLIAADKAAQDGQNTQTGGTSAGTLDVDLTPKFENSSKLVNGKKVNEANVTAAVKDLEEDFPENAKWDLTAVYESPVFGDCTGSKAFAAMLSDQVFGNIDVEKGDIKSIKPGDVVYLAEKDRYVLVQQADEDELVYVSCNKQGVVVWDSEVDEDDLTEWDSVYTRYDADDSAEDKGDEAVLSNGKAVTQANVIDMIEEFLDEQYDEGDGWTYSYKSSHFKSTRVSGGEAFAYYFSDHIFEDLEVEELDDFEDLRAGDVIYWDDEEEYLFVTEVDGDTVSYMGVASEEIYADDLDVDDLDSKDKAWTRYPAEDADDEDEEAVLSNGKAVTRANVAALVDKFLDEKYSEGDAWDSSYKSSYFKSSRVSGSEAFAYYFSDYIFDDLKVTELDDFDDLRVGDVIYWDDYEEYVVVTNVDGDEIDYAGVNNKKVYEDTLELDDLDSKDKAWTRYPAQDEDKDDSKAVLKNGKAVTRANVAALVDKFLDEEYSKGDAWEYSYKSSYFKSSRVSGSEAFSYFFSDYIFGELKVNEVDDFDELRVGDVIYWNDYQEYVVVTNVDGDEIDYVGVENKKVYEDTLDVDDLDSKDSAWTRYPAADEDEDEAVLKNGKAVTKANVAALVEKFLDEEYGEGDAWEYSYKSSCFKSSRVSGSEAFSYYFSDYIFDDLKVTELDDFEDLRVGDVIYWDDYEEYVVVTNVDGDEIDYVGVYNKKVYKDTLDVDDLDGKDSAWTRYPN